MSAHPPENDAWRPLLEAVVKACDCWPETALRAAPHYAIKAKNHDEACPAARVIPPGSSEDGAA